MSYITVTDLRDEGVSETDLDDQRAIKLINLWQKFIEKVTDRWFEERDLDFYMDGNNRNKIFLRFPVIEIESLIIDIIAGETEPSALDVDTYRVYNRRGGSEGYDDRDNPIIQLVDGYFTKGPQNIRIIGTFGYLESDDTCPVLIKDAHKALVINNIPKKGNTEDVIQSKIASLITRQTVDKHSWEIKNLTGAMTLSGDWSIDRILDMYSRPMDIGAVG